ncbi:MAG: MmgE/PrpD family protein [Deltaproteobacteria bacterium]|nr:MmgE/PrpD family protein [Deltaproteobacteria bacterium]
MEFETDITREISLFAQTISYDELPGRVVEETRRLILDSLGCAIGGVNTEKGRIGIKFAEELSGTGDTTILGRARNAHPISSAFANGELMNALDYDALLSPPEHLTPYVMPACITCGEIDNVSGKELILSVAIAHEITTRLSDSLVFGNRFSVKLPEKGLTLALPTPGYGICLFGGIAGAGRLMGFTADEIANAMGIGGFSCPIPMLAKFAVTVPLSMTKYLSSGLLSQIEIVSLLLTSIGHSADRGVLNGEYGFFRFFGCDTWSPERMVEGLGREWRFPDRIFYKTYPCCGAMQNVLGLFDRIITTRHLYPEDMEEVAVVLNPLGELPAWKNPDVISHVDIQFNTAFLFSLLAHRIEPGPLWQNEEVLSNRKIREFAKKVRVVTSLDRDSEGRPDITVVTTRGKGQKVYSERGLSIAAEMSQESLIEKFKRNTQAVIGESKAMDSVDAILRLEEQEDISGLMKLLVP